MKRTAKTQDPTVEDPNRRACRRKPREDRAFEARTHVESSAHEELRPENKHE
jgi:hypothetical protein